GELRRRKGVLDQLAKLQATGIHERQEDDQEHTNQLRCRKRDRVVPANCDRRNQVFRFADWRDQDTEVSSKADGDSRERSSLKHQKQSPAVKETPERRKRFA